MGVKHRRRARIGAWQLAGGDGLRGARGSGGGSDGEDGPGESWSGENICPRSRYPLIFSPSASVMFVPTLNLCVQLRCLIGLIQWLK